METAIVVLITVALVTYLATVIHAATMRSLAERGDEERPETHLITWPRWMFGLLLLLVSLWVLYHVRPILTPFLLGALAAYVLNPVVDRMVTRGSTRGRAVALVFLLLLALVALAAFLIIPAVVNEARTFASDYDTYAARARGLVTDLNEVANRVAGRLGIPPREVQRFFRQFNHRAETSGSDVLLSVWSGLNRGLEILLLLVLTPVVTFWLLRDYHRLGGVLLRLVPETHRSSTVEIAGEINRIVGGYLLGLLTMMVLVGTYSSLVLTLLGVRYSLLLGIITGVLSIIPYFGFPTAMVVIALTMVATGQSVGMIVLAIALHILGNIGSDYLVYPRVVGSRVGLHPLVVIFALLAGGALLQFLGILLAVPTAGVIKMLFCRFWPEPFACQESKPA